MEIDLSKQPPLMVRDAVHMPVVACIAGEDLEPGQYVTVPKSKTDPAMKSEKWTGAIATPFVLRAIKKGERFWACLPPGTIKGMSHVWSSDKWYDDGASGSLMARVAEEAGISLGYLVEVISYLVGNPEDRSFEFEDYQPVNVLGNLTKDQWQALADEYCDDAGITRVQFGKTPAIDYYRCC